MSIYNVLLVLSVIVAILLVLMVLFTGKADAMSGGGGSIRTNFKGKAGFDDYMSRATFILGALFISLMFLLNFLASSK